MPNMSPRWSPGILFGAVCMVLLLASAGCSDGSSNGANSTSIAPDNGFVTLGITDAPVDDAAEVVVVVTGVELQRGPESTITINFDTPKRIDLLRYRDGASFNLLDNQAVLPGNYQWLRLRITTEQNLQSGSYIKLRDGRQFPLYIPSGAETGLKLSKPFVVAQRATTRLMIDFDLRKSVVAPPGQSPNWILKPSLRLVDLLEVGALKGTVDIAALALAQQTTVANCKPGVYVYEGSSVTPDDMDGVATDGVDPLIYQPLTPAAPGAPVNHSFQFPAAGDYTVAATCQADV
ncbi:MAG: DUF4382 domain-containing protein, partial [Gammaproteobacteria bacterium]|nr:DUF4382 domain-containing protein [Gammaproteobacteria bacterium]